MKSEFFGILLLAICVFGQDSSSGCRYWCRSPEGQAFCCETEAQPLSPPIAKPDHLGECPPVRPVCPATKFGPPKTCSSDGSCPGVEKCCYDRCLETTVCKTPIYLGGGTIGGPIGGGGLGGLIGGPIGSGGHGRPIGGGGHGRPIGGGGHGRPIGGGGHGRPIGGGGQGRPIGAGGHGSPIGGGGHGHSFEGGSIGGPIGGGGIGGPIGGGEIGGPIGGGGIGGPIGGGGIGAPIGGGGNGGQIQHPPGSDVDLTEFLRKKP